MTISYQQLREFIERRFHPLVLVVSTDGAELSCRKNRLTLIDLLNPFSALSRDVHARTTGDPYPLTNFRVRLTDFGKMTPVPEDSREAWFTQIGKESLNLKNTNHMNRHLDWQGVIERLVQEPDPSRPDLPQEDTKKLLSNITSPLFPRFRDDYFQSCRFSCYDTFDHPVACILAVSSTSSDAISELKGLFSVNQPEFKNAAVDPQLFMYYVLVHDPSNGPSETEVQKIFNDMKTQFSATACKLLLLNSNTTGQLMVDPSIWIPPITIDNPTPCTEPVASLLSPDDMEGIRSLMSHFTDQLLSHLTRRVKSLHQSVSDRKQGKLGKMMSYWLGKNQSDSRPLGDGPRFTHDTCEMQQRKLADLCFMMHDYDTAHSMYRALKSEFSSNEHRSLYAYQAACFEALGMSSFLLQQRRDTKEADSYFDQSSQNYRRASRLDYALRVRLLQYSMMKLVGGNGRRGAEIMQKSGELFEKRHFYNAILCEEQALSFLILNPAAPWHALQSNTRKFAFYMAWAGNKFSCSGCPDLALRAYMLSETVYRNRSIERWQHINEHIQLTLSRLWQQKAEPNGALHHIGLYITKADQVQPAKLSEFGQCLRNYLTQSNKTVYNGLVLPEIHPTDISTRANPSSEILYPEQLVNMPQHLAAIRSEWATMQEDLIDFLQERQRIVYLHPQAQGKPKKGNAAEYKPQVVLQGEQAVVNITVSNPVTVPLKMTEVVLLFEVHSTMPDPFAPVADDAVVHRGVAVPQVVIQPKEACTVPLPFCVGTVGYARIIGVEWGVYAEGLTHANRGSYNFVKGTARPDVNPISVDRAVKSLVFHVMPPMPLLHMKLSSTPPHHMVDGQVMQTTIELVNKGDVPLEQLFVKLSPANNHFTNIVAPPAGVMQESGAARGVADVVVLDKPMAPGEVTSLDLWIRADAAQRGERMVMNYMPFMVAYSGVPAEEGSTTRLFRLCRMVVTVAVNPSLSLRALCLPPAARAGQGSPDNPFIVTLEVRNMRPRNAASRTSRNPYANIQLHQISSYSPTWNVDLLDPDRTHSPITVEDGCTSILSLRVWKSDRTDSEPIVSDPVPPPEGHEGKDLRKDPWQYFILNSTPDIEASTGGSGSLGKKAESSGGNISSMFLDRKEKLRDYTTPALAENVSLGSIAHPLSLTVFWSSSVTGADRCYGQIIGCCQPLKASLKPPRLWQDPSQGGTNLLRRVVHSSPSPSPSPSSRPVSPTPDSSPFPPQQAALAAVPQEGIVGLTIRAPMVLYHSFSEQPLLQVPVSIKLSNHFHQPRTLWVHLMNTTTAYILPPTSTSAPPTSATPPPLMRGSASSPPPPPAPPQAALASHPTFSWIGKRKFKVSLAAHQSLGVEATALFTRYGVFNLNQLLIKDGPHSTDNTVANSQGERGSSDEGWYIDIRPQLRVEEDTALAEPPPPQPPQSDIIAHTEELLASPFIPEPPPIVDSEIAGSPEPATVTEEEQEGSAIVGPQIADLVPPSSSPPPDSMM